MTDTSNTVLTYDAAGALLGVGLRQIQHLIRTGRLIRLPTGRILPSGHHERGVSRASVERMLASRAARREGGVIASVRTDQSPAGGSATPSALPAIVPAAGLPQAPGDTAALSAPAAAPSLTQLALSPQRAPDHLPITRDAIPDLAAMQTAGLGPQAESWSDRVRAVSEFRDRAARTPHGRRGALLREVASLHNLSERTLYRLLSAERDGGPTALVPGWSRLRGTTCLPPELQLQVRDAYLQQTQPTVAAVYKRVVLPWYAGDGRCAPHVSVVRRWIKGHVLPLEEVAFRQGPRAYTARCEPKVTRDWRSAGQNGWWVADHRRWDVMVRDGQGRMRRPWVTMLTDVYSAAIVGWRVCDRPTAATVCHALREAILTFGLPRHWLRDNGREFCANRLGGKARRAPSDRSDSSNRLLNPRSADLGSHHRWPARMPDDVERSAIWQVLGVELHTALPYHPWAKCIESFFRAFRDQWERDVPGWTGQSAARKPEQLAGQLKRGLVLLWDEFEDVFTQQVQAWNESHVVGDRPAPPLGMYEGHEARRPDPSTLAYLCQAECDERVHAQGVRLGDRWYTGDYLSLYAGMKLHIRWDPGEPTHAYAYTPDGRCILLSPAPLGLYGDPGEALVVARRGGRLQREYLAHVAKLIRGAAPLDALDPTGAYRTVALRVAEERRLAAADTSASDQVQALEEAEAQPPPQRTRTIYARPAPEDGIERVDW